MYQLILSIAVLGLAAVLVFFGINYISEDALLSVGVHKRAAASWQAVSAAVKAEEIERRETPVPQVLNGSETAGVDVCGEAIINPAAQRDAGPCVIHEELVRYYGGGSIEIDDAVRIATYRINGAQPEICIEVTNADRSVVRAMEKLIRENPDRVGNEVAGTPQVVNSCKLDDQAPVAGAQGFSPTVYPASFAFWMKV